MHIHRHKRMKKADSVSEIQNTVFVLYWTIEANIQYTSFPVAFPYRYPVREKSVTS